MTSYLWDNDTMTWEPRDAVLRKRALVAASTSKRSDEVPLPHIISDCVELRSMLDGKIYTSKRAYYDSVKAGGCEIVGNDDQTKYSTPTYDEKKHTADIAADVKRAIQEVSSK